MISYIKTQWWRLLIALFSLVMACIYIFKPAPDTMTIEGLDAVLSNIVNAGLFFAGFIIWVFQSVIEYNSDRIELLEKKAEKYDALVDEVRALYEANRIDREHLQLMDIKINELRYTVQEELRK
jgi:hypothetical protein